MIRLAAAVAVTVCVSPAWLCAQTVLTVNTASADVYKSPSTGSPIIAHAPRGTVLAVTRELGSWVKVAWPATQDGIGYLHVSTGLIAHRSTPDRGQVAGVTSARAARESAPPIVPPTTAGAQRAGAVEQPSAVRPVYITQATHSLGLGGRMGGSTFGPNSVKSISIAWMP